MPLAAAGRDARGAPPGAHRRPTSTGSPRPRGGTCASTPTPRWAPARTRRPSRAAGAVVDAVERVLDGSLDRAFCAVRPPGHHATPDRAMGFCLLNNVAVGAAAALARGLKRVAVIDFDVHHGNGTQEAFWRDPRVLFVSSHQFPFYPGTGDLDEVGEGDGPGLHREPARCRPGMGDGEYRARLPRDRRADRPGVRPRARPRLGGLRRPPGRPARGHGDDAGRLRGADGRLPGRRLGGGPGPARGGPRGRLRPRRHRRVDGRRRRPDARTASGPTRRRPARRRPASRSASRPSARRMASRPARSAGRPRQATSRSPPFWPVRCSGGSGDGRATDEAVLAGRREIRRSAVFPRGLQERLRRPPRRAPEANGNGRPSGRPRFRAGRAWRGKLLCSCGLQAETP